jgi:ribosomal protein L29
MELVPCSFSDLGCDIDVCRGELEKHVEMGVARHMALLAKSHTKLQAERKVLSKQAEFKTEELTTLKAEHRELKEEHAKLKADLVALRTQEQAARAKQRADLVALQNEEVVVHAKLRADLVTLKTQGQAERAKLKADHKKSDTSIADVSKRLERLKILYTTQVDAIGSILQDAFDKQQSCDPTAARIYTVLREKSNLFPGDSLYLGFTENNVKCGHHYIVLSQGPKFKLEWKLVELGVGEAGFAIACATRLFRFSTQQCYTFELSLILMGQDFTYTASDQNLDVALHLDGDKSVLCVCCIKQKSNGHLIGTLPLKCSKLPELLRLQIVPHDIEHCECLCHYACEDADHQHQCFGCTNLCTATCHICYYCGEYYQGEIIESEID